jgi:hypothetical protein
VRRGALALLLAISLAGCASYRIVRTGEVQPRAVEEVKAELARLRQLPFLAPVPVVAVTAADAREMLAREMRRHFEPGELARLGRAYRALGLLPEDADLERALLDLYGDQVAGFYDPGTRRMVLVTEALEGGLLTRIVEGVLRRDLTGRLLLAHELTHALQDQHFGLDVGRGDLGEDDADLARRAVYEGDATLAGFGVALGQLTPRAAVSVAAKLERVPGDLAKAYPHVPALIRDTVAFQYVAGTNFVSWAYNHAGWEGVNALLALPPRSTEQVLHPEKYFVAPEYPLAIHVGALAPYVKGGWEVVEETTLGELVVRVLAERFFDRSRAAQVASGWDGDRLVALTRDGTVALVWLTAWDSEADAREFLEAYREIVAAKRGGMGPPPRGDGRGGPAGVTLAEPSDAVPGGSAAAPSGRSPAPPVHLEQRGEKVLVLEGPLDEDLGALAERIWRRSAFQATVPWVPLDLARRSAGVPAATAP